MIKPSPAKSSSHTKVKVNMQRDIPPQSSRTVSVLLVNYSVFFMFLHLIIQGFPFVTNQCWLTVSPLSQEYRHLHQP